MALLKPKAIRAQLVQLGIALEDMFIIDCWRVGTRPGMDGISPTDERVRFEGRDLIKLAERVEAFLRAIDVRHGIVLLCDLYAEENEPPNGVEWTHEYRVKGAILGVMSCLMMLMRNYAVRDTLFEQPERLVVATIEDGKIVVQEGRGEKMVKFLRDKTLHVVGSKSEQEGTMSTSKTEDQKLISVLKALLGPDKIKDREPLTPERREKLREMTQHVLQSLTPREEKVIRLRFGIGEKSDRTPEEVGEDFAVTRERIRQIEAKALRKLRHPSRSPKLRAFLEGNSSEMPKKEDK